MLRRAIVGIVVAGALGLVVGYLIFARDSQGYLSLKSLLAPSQNVLDSLVKQVTGITKIRQNILICGAVGAGIGLIVGMVSGSGQRRRWR
jgi:hypothetical protein